MNLDYHYAVIQVLSAAVGFDPIETYQIAYSSQYVDDNCTNFKVLNRKKENALMGMIRNICGENSKSIKAYTNIVTQSMDITNGAQSLQNVYVTFHFAPVGYNFSPEDSRFEATLRKGDEKKGIHEGKYLYPYNTIPGSDTSEAYLQSAFDSNNLYRVGIALHTYADTWSHQNFTGHWEEFNAGVSTNFFSKYNSPVIPPMGHAKAGHKPDKPNFKWHDCRLVHEDIDNNERFMEATSHIFDRLNTYRNGKNANQVKDFKKQVVLNDVQDILEVYDPSDNKGRIEALLKLSSKKEYYFKNESILPIYDQNIWENQAFDKQVIGLNDEKASETFMSGIIGKTKVWDDRYYWKNELLEQKAYQKTDWYQFQEAAKAHYIECKKIVYGKGLTLGDDPKGLESEKIAIELPKEVIVKKMNKEIYGDDPLQ